MIEVLRSQLLALRGQVDATLAVIDSCGVTVPDEGPPTCPHTDTENVGTFGDPTYQCQACQAIVPEP